MTAVAWYINDMKRKQEHAVRLQEIESLLENWTGPDLSGFGELVLEGSFRVHRVKKERAFFLFDRMLLIAKKRLERFVYNTHIFCCNLLLVETMKDPLCFKVSDQTIPKQQHVVQTKNQEEKRLWMHYLKRLIVENHPASLPQKARQVLGDNICQSPQFEQEHLKRTSASPRLDDFHAYHRGRRQSAPAKDIEAVFHPKASLKPAGSDGELAQADSLGSAGSSSTLASSVIEVEPGCSREEEQEEEELPPLSPAPTLSITEEILEFINQSRAREGLNSIKTDTEQFSDLLIENQPADQTNFTSPLPPVASPSSPSLGPAGQPAQDTDQIVTKEHPHHPTGVSPGEEGLGDTEHPNGAEEELNEKPRESERMDEKTEGAEKKQEEESREEEERGDAESTTPTPLSSTPPPLPSLAHPSIPAEGPRERERGNSADLPEEKERTETTSPKADLLRSMPPPKRAPHFSRSDKKLIEKIRSYYEAAAEAEKWVEEEEEEEEERGGEREGASPRRRNSFSHIPLGLVRESVSRFDVCRHQGAPEGSRSETRASEPTDGAVEASVSLSPPLFLDKQRESGVTDTCFVQPEPSIQTRSQGDGSGQNRPSKSVCSVLEGEKCLEGNGETSTGPMKERDRGRWEEGQDRQLGGSPPAGSAHNEKISMDAEDKNTEEITGPEQNQQNPEEPKEAEEPAEVPLMANKAQSSLTRTRAIARTRDRQLDSPGGKLEVLPDQIKVGHWSRHSRIVAANRALFEGSGSDVAGIGLFEASPVVDPTLMENSERILSKVQTLARMYGAKAGTMKVPLHQKRASVGWNPHWASTRPAGQRQDHIQAQCHAQNQNKYWQPTQNENQCQNKTDLNGPAKSHRHTRPQVRHEAKTLADAKLYENQTYTHTHTQYGTQTHTHAKTLNQSVGQTRNQTQNQDQNQEPEEKRTDEEERKEERKINTAEIFTSGYQETSAAPCVPLLFGHVLITEQFSPVHHQMNGYSLCQPRDILSAPPQQPRSPLGSRCSDASLVSATTAGECLPPETPPTFTPLSDQHAAPSEEMRGGSSLASPADGGLTPGSTSTTCTPSSRLPSQTEEEEEVNYTEEAHLEAEGAPSTKVEVNSGRQFYSIREHSSSVSTMTPSNHSGPDLSAHNQTQVARIHRDVQSEQNERLVQDNQDTRDVPLGQTIQELQGEQFNEDSQDVQHCQNNQDIQSSHAVQEMQGPKDKFSTGDKRGVQVTVEEHMIATECRKESEGGESILMAVSDQTQRPSENPDPDQDPYLTGIPTQTGAPHLREQGGADLLGVSASSRRGEPHKEEMSLKGTKEEVDKDDSSCQIKTSFSSSTCSEPTPDSELPGVSAPPEQPPTQPSHITFDVAPACQMGSEAPEISEVGGGEVASDTQSLVQLVEPDTNPAALPMAQLIDRLQTLTSQRPTNLLTTRGKQTQSNTWIATNATPPEQREPQDLSVPPVTAFSSTRPSTELPSGLASNLSGPPSAFRPNLQNRSPSPVGAFPSSSFGQAPPCSSPFRATPASSPAPFCDQRVISPTAVSRAIPCFSPTPPSSGRTSSVRAVPPSSPTPSSSSAFSRSLAASCISQSISQCMTKKNANRQQATPLNSVNRGPSLSPSLPSSHLRLRSPSPKVALNQQGSSSATHVQLGGTKDRYQHARCSPALSRSSCPVPVQVSHPHQPQHVPLPHQPLSNSSFPSPSPYHCKPDAISDSSLSVNSSNNNNNINSGLTICTTPINSVNHLHSSTDVDLRNGSWLVSQRKTGQTNGIGNTMAAQHSHDPLWLGSHNRIARPFSASEPNSRVQSPSPSSCPSPASFTRLYSPPLQHNFSSPMANKPPHPRNARAGSVSSHNPLGLTLELPRASLARSATGPSSFPSPHILSPPPIGVSVNSWTNHIAKPQPQNAQPAPSSRSASLISPGWENTSSSLSYLQSSRASSPSTAVSGISSCTQTTSHMTSQNLGRFHGSSLPFSTSLADRPPSPAQRSPSGLRRSWAENSRTSTSFGGTLEGSFDQQQSGLISPTSGWSSYGSSPSCISPRPGLQSPLSPSLPTGNGTLGGQHFTSVPWPDVKELLTKYDGADLPDRSRTSPAFSPTHSSSSEPPTGWDDPPPEEGNCRSQLICAYVACPSASQNPVPPPCLSLGRTSPLLPNRQQHQSYQPHFKPQPTFQTSTTPPSPSSPLTALTRPGNQKTSYATTVNLQIAGSGRITSFSTAQVSLTQTLQAGAGAAAQGAGPGVRRVSINGLSSPCASPSSPPGL